MIKNLPEFCEAKLKSERVSVRSRILKIEQWLNEYKPKKDPEIPKGMEV